MFTSVLKVVSSALGSMVMKLMTEEFFKWLFLWASEKAVKETKWKWDDELHEKVKKSVEP